VIAPLIYIAGPFRGKTPLDVQRNIEYARDVALKVAELGGGCFPVCPHLNTAPFDKQLTDQFWLAGDLELMHRCDAMVLTDNWEQSSGARAEWEAWNDRNRPWHVYTTYAGGGTKDEQLRMFLQSVMDANTGLEWRKTVGLP
jgi:hypothetical protein